MGRGGFIGIIVMIRWRVISFKWYGLVGDGCLSVFKNSLNGIYLVYLVLGCVVS